MFPGLMTPIELMLSMLAADMIFISIPTMNKSYDQYLKWRFDHKQSINCWIIHDNSGSPHSTKLSHEQNERHLAIDTLTCALVKWKV